jgi:hypothetical protein
MRRADGQDARGGRFDLRAESEESELVEGSPPLSLSLLVVQRPLAPLLWLIIRFLLHHVPLLPLTNDSRPPQLKKDYLSGVGDSLDLVVIGAYFGKGKRTSLYGAFLLACYDPDTESYQTCCKIGTGFSEADLASHYEVLKPLELTGPPRKGQVQVGGAKPDVWFEPKVVWEVLTADLSLSPIYTAAVGIVSGLLLPLVSIVCVNERHRG